MTHTKPDKKFVIFTLIYALCAFVLSFLLYKNNYSSQNATYTDIRFSNDGNSYCSETLSFPAGNYFSTISCTVPCDCRFVVYSGADEMYSEEISASDEYREIVAAYTLTKRTSDYHMAFLGTDDSDINVYSISYVSEKPINNDAKVKACISMILLGVIYVALLMYYFKRISRLQLISFIVLFSCALFASSPLMTDHLIYGHDLRCHTGRIDGLRNAFMDGQRVPYIIPDAYNGFGILQFEYPWIFLLIPAFLRLCDVSMVLAYQVLLFLINISTAFVCYYSVRSVITHIYSGNTPLNTDSNAVDSIKDNNQVTLVSLVCSLFYTLSTYRLSDVYIRAAMGEMLAMIFLPLLVAGLYHVCTGEKNKWYLLLIALTGILQSHILSCVLIIPLMIIITIPFIKQIIAEKRWIQLLYAAVSFLLINLWYIIPFVRFFMMPLNTEAFTEYWVINNIVHLKNLFLSAVHNGFADDDRFTPSLGMCALVCIIIVLVYFVVLLKQKKQSEDRKDNLNNSSIKLLLSCACGIVLFIIISSEIIPWNYLEAHFPRLWKCIHMIQFPYRFLTVAMVCIVYALAVSLMKLLDTEHFSKYLLPVSALILVFALYDSGTLMDSYENCGWVTFKTYSGGFVSYTPRDYLPGGINVETMNDNTPLISSGEITEYNKNGTSITFTYSSSEDAVATMPLNYYPCYQAVLETGDKIALSAWEDKRMLMILPAGQHTVSIRVKYSRVTFF